MVSKFSILRKKGECTAGIGDSINARYNSLRYNFERNSGPSWERFVVAFSRYLAQLHGFNWSQNPRTDSSHCNPIPTRGFSKEITGTDGQVTG